MASLPIAVSLFSNCNPPPLHYGNAGSGSKRSSRLTTSPTNFQENAHTVRRTRLDTVRTVCIVEHFPCIAGGMVLW